VHGGSRIVSMRVDQIYLNKRSSRMTSNWAYYRITSSGAGWIRKHSTRTAESSMRLRC
jgi:hypothetical protein